MSTEWLVAPDYSPTDAEIGRTGNALVTAFTDLAEMEVGAYVQIWPDGKLSVELDAISICVLAKAVLSALRWEENMTQRIPEGIIDEAEELLQTARFGLEDLKSRPERARSGLRNVVVFGRAVTFALQNLRGKVADFDQWYSPHRLTLSKSPVAAYFYELRTRIEKQAHSLPVITRLQGVRIAIDDLKRFQPAPPNATSFIIGDQNGGTGWKIKTSSGRTEMYYVDLPPDMGQIDLVFTDFASQPGDPVFDQRTVAELAEEYLEMIDKIVQSARLQFGS